jgi:hypothetical protein
MTQRGVIERWETALYSDGSPSPYEISSEGRVRRNGKILRGSTATRSGYKLQVMYRPGHKPEGRYIHELVCEAFHGPRPSAEHEANHQNGRILENQWWNLKWMTHAENWEHARMWGLLGNTSRPGEMNGRSRFTEETIREIRATIGTVSNKEWARRLDSHASWICKIRRGAAWQHLL